MIALPIPWNRSKWTTMSFASTLYLHPILELLLDNIPAQWRAEVRLGLQEALVNAAKHGNQLDPNKTIIVQFLITDREYAWIITDQGSGFVPHCSCHQSIEEHIPPEESESGRGLCILHEVFDRVHWNREGTQLTVAKSVKKNQRKQTLVN